jgi:predicted naringenin-chalcone synthase
VVNVAVVTGQGSAFPTQLDQQTIWDTVFARHHGHDRVARRIFLGSGVTTRHTVLDPRVEDVSGWSTGARMRRYETEAPPLGRAAVAAALADAGLRPDEVGLFVVASCTGYATPGVDIRIAHELGMATDVRRLVVGHMGCYAAIPALGAATDFVRARGRPAVVLCLELTSLHHQPAPDERDLEQIVVHALFGDAAAAIVLEPDAPTGLAVLDTTAVTAPASAELMTWDVTDHGFRMGLSPKVPDVLADHVVDATRTLLGPHALGVDDVAGWAVHPGGPRIVEVVSERLGLDATAVASSLAVLADHGNCSSATVLLIVQRLRDRLRPGDPVVAMAFGPGLTLCSALLQTR